MKILSILRDVANRLSEDKHDCCEKCRDSKRQCLEGLEQAYQGSRLPDPAGSGER